MPTPPLSPARPRRLSTSVRLGGVFLLLAVITGGNLVFSGLMHGSIANVAGLINQSGQLRYLSQQTASDSANFALEPSEAARQTVLETEVAFEMRYARVENDIAQLHPLLHRAGDNLDRHLQRVDETWQRQRIALARVRTQPDMAARRAAQRVVAIQAKLLLERTDALVSALQTAAHTANRRVEFIVYLVQALSGLLMLGVFLYAIFYVRARITPPVHTLSEALRRFAAGLLATHRD